MHLVVALKPMRQKKMRDSVQRTVFGLGSHHVVGVVCDLHKFGHIGERHLRWLLDCDLLPVPAYRSNVLSASQSVSRGAIRGHVRGQKVTNANAPNLSS